MSLEKGSDDLNELTDFEAFLENDFNAMEFANELILATNTNYDNELDLTTPSKRLGYDLNEVDKRVVTLAGDNYEILMKEVNKLDDVQMHFQLLNPSLTQVNKSFSKLDKDIVKPYTEAMELHGALKRIHTTSTLLRSATYFIHLIQNLEEASNNEMIGQSPFRDLVKACNHYNSLKKHLNDSPYLKSLKIVRDYDSILQTHKLKFQDVCRLNFKNFKPTTDQGIIANILIAYSIISPEGLCNSVQQFLNDQVSISLNILSKTLTSPRNFENAFKDVTNKGLIISKISTKMSQLSWSVNTNNVSISSSNSNQNNDSNTNNSPGTMLEEVSKILDLQSFLSAFWRDIATGFESKLKETLNRGGPVAKSLRTYGTSIRNSIKHNILSSDFSETMKEDGIEARMMLNSVNALDKDNTRR
ncbi:hypothetical protein PACTADRAFT_48762 [Pachysolen tannophilus NRRL Y-2460]|uniref:Conserved oligomeric Golgi complex subunit 5 n=1 Tax=Pachysolen tannophilus NRRL Y-2460 TaxID=669874 RepID=A0A1E4TZ10_PACTA|nr:hypothetical protein PACTADRAFT_48762 [Pachysolen tannophilus NRRL Y-2460]